ncbi:hypothetical protein HY480_02760 [Candidatus Uhrbacteria bacterium]|nr:hypothetical protein [Candidatus Uhrbacteria bacterium]
MHTNHLHRVAMLVGVSASLLLSIPIAARAACPPGTVQGAGPVQPGGEPPCVPIEGWRAAPQELPNPLPTSDIPTIVGNIIRAGFGVMGSIALAMFVWGGFLWLTSGGVSERIEKGKQTMLWAALGIGVIFGSYAIVQFVIGIVANRT